MSGKCWVMLQPVLGYPAHRCLWRPCFGLGGPSNLPVNQFSDRLPTLIISDLFLRHLKHIITCHWAPGMASSPAMISAPARSVLCALARVHALLDPDVVAGVAGVGLVALGLAWGCGPCKWSSYKSSQSHPTTFGTHLTSATLFAHIINQVRVDLI